MTVTVSAKDDFSLTLRTYEQKMNDANAATEKSGRVTKQTASDWDTFKSVVGGFIALGIAQKLAGVAVEMVNLGRDVNFAEAQFTQLAGGVNEAQTMLEMMRQSTNGAVDDLTLMSGAVQGMRMNLAATPDEMAKLVEMAVKLRRPTEDAASAINDFMMLLSQQSILRLDNFGFSSGKVRDRINELLESGEALNRSEAFKMAVLEEGENAIDRLGGAADASSTAISRLEVRWQNFWQNASQQAANAAEDIAASIESFLRYDIGGEQYVPQMVLPEGGYSPKPTHRAADAMAESAAQIDFLSQQIEGLSQLVQLRQQIADITVRPFMTEEDAEALRAAADEAERLAEEMKKADEANDALYTDDQLAIAEQTAESAGELAKQAEAAAKAFANITLADIFGTGKGGTLGEIGDLISGAMEDLNQSQEAITNFQNMIDSLSGRTSLSSRTVENVIAPTIASVAQFSPEQASFMATTLDNTLKEAVLQGVNVNDPEFITQLTEKFRGDVPFKLFDYTEFVASFVDSNTPAAEIVGSVTTMNEQMTALAAEPITAVDTGMANIATSATTSESALKGMKTSLEEMGQKVHTVQIKPELVDVPAMIAMLLPGLLQLVQGSGGTMPGTDSRASTSRGIVPSPR